MFHLPQKTTKTSPTPTGQRTYRPSAAIPYVNGLSETLGRAFARHRVNIIHKPTNTIRQLLVSPKDKTKDGDKCGVIYSVGCGDCDKSYIGETARAFNIRLKEHRRTNCEPPVLTGVGEHLKLTGHTITDEKTKILAREDEYFRRKIREAVEIRVAKPVLNKDQGYDLPPIYNPVLSPSPDPRGSGDPEAV